MSDASNVETDKTAIPDNQTVENQARESGWHTIRKISPYLWPEDKPWVKQRVVIAMVALGISKLVAVFAPFLYKAVVDLLAGESNEQEWLFALGAIGLVVAYGMNQVFKVGFEELRNVVFAKVGQRALRSVALETISHIHKLSLRYHVTRKTGALSRVMERGVKGIDFLLRFILFSIGPLLLELILISIILLFAFDFWYLLVVSVTVTTYIVFTAKVTEWRVRIRKEMNEKDKDANQKAIDSLLNFETVKYFGAEKRETKRYDDSMEGFEAASLKTVNSLALLNLGQALLINGGMVLALLLAVRDVSSGALTVGGFVMVNAYMMQVMMPLNFLGYVYREIRQSLIDMGEMFDLLRQVPDVKDKENAPDLNVKQGEVVFDQIDFHYDPQRQILNNISLNIEAGQTVAIVGSSGSGKSTLGRLLFRFYDVTSGAIRIDGQDLRDVTQDSLHNAIGVVPQDTVLFNDSIYYNIAYGRPDATYEEVVQAAKAAKIHSFVEQLPDGYETQVGERGLKLSGGEKQRVGIARTLLKNPPILLLDEATSALDTETEREIQESLKQMGEGRTVLTIAHRLSTIVDSDVIVVFSEGQIIERGSHEALLKKGGQYAQMWQSQLRE
ncbi:ABC transporter B family member 25 [Vibrio nigripulchritudo SFn27]|uniref:ABC transporter B family member 25 n=1 Tax=Vibrio nigripulchritudo TaxID=28173 RepID=U4K2Q3_9VIBR|nr:ABC transporter ATP-binding protein/permease [Vibrio nigripulchritudo]CCN84266.1 ABC transporter B family member 25 [Vibrio nigripulchritudo BLFn1]CCN89520.1 ABC transporter B family member 25 [Vibrio nigripulchritudo SFn27]CCN93988.1 ABC transporter B family member 25 [Vibrio nigripulchritudo ENn2]CCO43157.1 ABC transporter B family member 25 [Vibrio nigripulchritudo SFn135]CCO55400.1 ABC transporter B family member 25 [Vibrio nigripulchritudo Wn13]